MIRDFANLNPVKVITLSVFHSKNVIIPLLLLCFFSRPPFPQNSWTLLILYFKSENNEVWREAERGRSWWEAPVFRFSNFCFSNFFGLKKWEYPSIRWTSVLGNREYNFITFWVQLFFFRSNSSRQVDRSNNVTSKNIWRSFQSEARLSSEVLVDERTDRGEGRLSKLVVRSSKISLQGQVIIG